MGRIIYPASSYCEGEIHLPGYLMQQIAVLSSSGARVTSEVANRNVTGAATTSWEQLGSTITGPFCLTIFAVDPDYSSYGGELRVVSDSVTLYSKVCGVTGTNFLVGIPFPNQECLGPITCRDSLQLWTRRTSSSFQVKVEWSGYYFDW